MLKRLFIKTFCFVFLIFIMNEELLSWSKKTVFLVILPIKDTNKKTRKSAIKD